MVILWLSRGIITTERPLPFRSLVVVLRITNKCRCPVQWRWVVIKARHSITITAEVAVLHSVPGLDYCLLLHHSYWPTNMRVMYLLPLKSSTNNIDDSSKLIQNLLLLLILLFMFLLLCLSSFSYFHSHLQVVKLWQWREVVALLLDILKWKVLDGSLFRFQTGFLRIRLFVFNSMTIDRLTR